MGWKARKDYKDRITRMESEAGKVWNLENIIYFPVKGKGKNVWVELKLLEK